MEKKKIPPSYRIGRYKIKNALFCVLLLVTFLFLISSKNVLIASESGSKKEEKVEKSNKETMPKKSVRQKKPKKTVEKVRKKVEKRKKRKEKGEKKKKREKEILVIGDSLAYAMSLNNTYTGVTRRDEMYWLTEGGVGINFIPKDFEIVLGKTMPRAINNTLTETMKVDLLKEVKEKKIKYIAVLIGINGSDERGAKETVKRLEEMKKKTECEVCYLSAFPIVDAKAEQNGYQVRDSRAVSYNGWVKEGLKETGIEYIDSYSAVKQQKDYTRYTWDGIHYQKKIYDKVIEALFEKIERIEEGKENLRKWKKGIPRIK